MVSYHGSYKGIGEMLCSDFMLAEMVRRAANVMAEAERTAPVYRGGKHPGRYKRSFRVEGGVMRRRWTSENGERMKTRRARGRVLNDAPEALSVEYGTRNNPRHSTMRNALKAAR